MSEINNIKQKPSFEALAWGPFGVVLFLCLSYTLIFSFLYSEHPIYRPTLLAFINALDPIAIFFTTPMPIMIRYETLIGESTDVIGINVVRHLLAINISIVLLSLVVSIPLVRKLSYLYEARAREHASLKKKEGISILTNFMLGISLCLLVPVWISNPSNYNVLFPTQIHLNIFHSVSFSLNFSVFYVFVFHFIALFIYKRRFAKKNI